MPKKPTIKTLTKKLDTIFSEYIRRKDADKNGLVQCFTCGVIKYWKGEGIQCGHFISRSKKAIRWDENNAKPQCYSCNCGRYGEQFIFGQKLGSTITDELFRKSRQIYRGDITELQNKIEYFKEKLKKLDSK